MQPYRAKKVRFSLPGDHNEQPAGILRQPTMRVATREESAGAGPLQRYASMTESSSQKNHMLHKRLIARETLNGMRSYLFEALNFHAEHMKRVLYVPSVEMLFELITFVNQLRRIKMDVAKREEKLLRSIMNCKTRHPHEQLDEPRFSNTSPYAKNAIRAHTKRERRQNGFFLLRFASKELKLPVTLLRDLPTLQRSFQEKEAFKKRLAKFNKIEYYQMPDGSLVAQVDSAPQSPADRITIPPRSPATDPVFYGKLHGALAPLPELNLPGARVDYKAGPSGMQRAPSYQEVAAAVASAAGPSVGRTTPMQSTFNQPARPTYFYPGVAVTNYQAAPPPPPVGAQFPLQPQLQRQNVPFSQPQAVAQQQMIYRGQMRQVVPQQGNTQQPILPRVAQHPQHLQQATHVLQPGMAQQHMLRPGMQQAPLGMQGQMMPMAGQVVQMQPMHGQPMQHGAMGVASQGNYPQAQLFHAQGASVMPTNFVQGQQIGPQMNKQQQRR